MAQATHNLGLDELLALLCDATLEPQSIAEEIELSGAGRATAQEIGRARGVLRGLGLARPTPTATPSPTPNATGTSTTTTTSTAIPTEAAAEPTALAAGIGELPDQLAVALVHAAGKAGRQEVLRELALGAKKALAKEAKRELQRLKQRGVPVAEVRPGGETVLRPIPEPEAPACYATSIDPYGQRGVWWTRAARGGIDVVQAVLSDVRGIFAIDALAVSRRSFRDFVKGLPRREEMITVEISRDHARYLIAAAAEQGARNGFSPPAEYAEALRILGPAPSESPPPLVLDFGPEGELPYMGAGATLFQDPLFRPWIPEEDVLRAFALKVEEIGVSQLYVDARQRKEARDHAVAVAADAYFTPQRRAVYAGRLVEMARVLSSEGRLEPARIALATAHALQAEAGSQNPFCRALFAHVLRDRSEGETAAESEREASALIEVP